MNELAPWREAISLRARGDAELARCLEGYVSAALAEGAGGGSPALARLDTLAAAESVVRHLARAHGDLAEAIVAAAELPAARRDADTALAHLRAAWVFLARGPEVSALPALERARAHIFHCACESLRLLVLVQLGRLLVIAGDAPRATVILLEGADLAGQLGARREEAKLCGNLGFLYGETDGEAYEVYTRRALALSRDVGELRLVALSLCNLGGSLVQQGRLDEARACLEEGMPLAQAHGFDQLVALFHAARGGLAAALGDMDGAEVFYGRSSAYFEAVGDSFQVSRQHVRMAQHFLRAGRLEAARARAEQALALADASDAHHTVAWQAHTVLSEALEGSGDVPAALAALRAANARRERLLADRTVERLRLLTLQGDVERAVREAEVERARAYELERSLAEQSALRAGFEHLVRVDPLTGLYNRRHAQEAAHRELARMVRSWRPLSVVLLDADAFKAVNDTYGHLVGDEVLVAIARRLQAVLRKGDLATRWGGEEFCIVLPDTDEAGGIMAAERLLQAIRATPVETSAGPLRVTASAGVTEAMAGERTLDALVARADAALYAAKRAGRDRVVSSGVTHGAPVVSSLPSA